MAKVQEATYDEMESKLGEERRGFFGRFLEQSLRQGDLGAKPEAPLCKRCGKPMKFKGYPKKTVHGLETDARIARAYYVCPTCKVGFFPLDRLFRLRRDSWTESLVEEAARVATKEPSLAVATETLCDLTHVDISKTTVWEHHKEVTEQNQRELEKEEQEVPYWILAKDVQAMEWVGPQDPVESHTSVSIDGLTILVRGEGYREVKMVSVSEVVEQDKREAHDREKTKTEDPPKTEDPESVTGEQDDLKLTRHSYRAVLGDKAAFAPALKGELARDRVRDVDKITTVNDGAEWIWDLVESYVPQWRVEVLDWPHAMENLAKAAKAGLGGGTKEAVKWLKQRETELWHGQVVQVEIALHNLPRRYKERGKAIRQVKGYVDRHSQRLEYDRFRGEGRPIGSGTVESGAKNVVQWRMKRGGQHWSPDGAMRMLAAVGELCSKRWSADERRLPKAA
jgi:hypothetical protein